MDKRRENILPKRLRAKSVSDMFFEVSKAINREVVMSRKTLTLALACLLISAVAFAADSPMRVGCDVKAPVLVNRVDPIYPELAKQSRLSGLVILEVVIDHTGNVTDVRVLKPLPFGLTESAVDAVKQWHFEPATLHGKAVDVIFNLTINFKLDNQDESENN
jgi:TonB family protein